MSWFIPISAVEIIAYSFIPSNFSIFEKYSSASLLLSVPEYTLKLYPVSCTLNEDTENKLSITDVIEINRTMLKNIENMVVLYFFLLLLKFFLAITPSIPNNFLVILYSFILFPFFFCFFNCLFVILISDFSLIASIGEILPALILGLIKEMAIIIIEINIAITMAGQDITKVRLKLSIKGSTPLFMILFTINSTIPIAPTPIIIPSGIDISPRIAPSKNMLFLICFEVAPILAIIPSSLVFSVKDILKLLLITNAEVNNIITITTVIIPITKVIVPLLPNTPKYSSKLLFVSTFEICKSSSKYCTKSYASEGFFSKIVIPILLPSSSLSSFVIIVYPGAE